MTNNLPSTMYVRKCDECGHKQKSTPPPEVGGNSEFYQWGEMPCKKCKSSGLDYGGEGTYKEVNGKLERIEEDTSQAQDKADEQKTYAGMTVGDTVFFVVQGTIHNGTLNSIYYPEGTVHSTYDSQLHTVDLSTIYPYTAKIVYAVSRHLAVTIHAQLEIEKAKKDVERTMEEYIAAAQDLKEI